MTDLAEIKMLQVNARRSGRVCNLFFDEAGNLTGVFYKDRIWDPLSFAETERSKPKWYNL